MEVTVATLINKKRHYTITQAHKEYEGFLSGNIPYNTFYKKFRVWSKEHGVKFIEVKKLKFYPTSEIMHFINEYEYITHYQLPKQNKEHKA